MMSTNGHVPNLPDERIDLLVDGELPEGERRDLLLALEETPGAWRRCATAFLEAQSFKQEMGAIRRDETSGQVPPPTVKRRLRWGTWPTLPAMACSFFVAFGLGLLLRDAWRGGDATGPAPTQIAGGPAGPEQDASEANREDEVPAPGVSPDSRTVLVQLPLEDGPDGARSIQIPAIERDRLDPEWLEGFRPPSLPADLLEALHQSGHRVRQFRRVLRVPMEDDRELVVPVDQFEFRYVGDSVYQ